LASTGHPGVSPAITRANSSARSNVFTKFLLQTCQYQLSTALKCVFQDLQQDTPSHCVTRLHFLSFAQLSKNGFKLIKSFLTDRLRSGLSSHVCTFFK
jgi:hypothetical protein